MRRTCSLGGCRRVQTRRVPFCPFHAAMVPDALARVWDPNALWMAQAHIKDYLQLAGEHGLIRCLSYSQPWATTIVDGPKRAENRTWPLKLRGESLWLGLHAAKRPDRDAVPFVQKHWPACPPATELPTSAVLAITRFSRWVRHEARGPRLFGEDPWSFGPYVGVIEQVVRLPAPMACRGSLGLWLPPIEIQRAMQDAIREAA